MNILNSSLPTKQPDGDSTKHLADALVAMKCLSERLGDIGVIDPEQLRYTVMAREDRKPVVLALHKQGMSTRQIADIVGVGNKTVHRDIQELVSNDTKSVSNDTENRIDVSRPYEDADSGVIAQEKKNVHVSNNSGENEWYTPPEYILAARYCMGGIDLDPASCVIANRTVRADIFYTLQDNGLDKNWSGRVWMNPPYAQPAIADFCKKLVDSLPSIEAACVLVNNATDTAWFRMMADNCAAICFITGRIRFIDPSGKPSGAPLQGQAVLYFGSNIEAFRDAFSKFGFVLWKTTKEK